jgi:DNA (cytosine-5)-methyltransferase 1
VTVGSLFSGVGGIELGLEMCGLGPVLWLCESEAFPRAVLEDRFPGVPIFRDVRHIDARAARPDLLCGGFPCQDVSIAGRRRGLAGERSGLWWEFRRVVRQLRPRFVFIENVASGWRRWLPVVRRSLWRVGYASLPLCVRAHDVGAPHERGRVFVLAYAAGARLEGGGQGLPGHGGVAGTGLQLADSDSGGRGGIGLPERELVGAPGGLVDRRYPPGWEFPPGPAVIHAWNGPEPAVRRAVDGLSRWVDKARLQALGNAVVPHAAARAWMTLAALVPGAS